MYPLTKLTLRFTTLLLIIFMAPATFAWGWEGHKLICGLAEQKLNLAGKNFVAQLLAEGADLKGGVVTSFVESCLWADDVKHAGRKSTYEHHFINVPDEARLIDLQRDCAALNCTAVGVQQALTYLSREPSGNREVARRAAALRFLGHYVGDLHQPMHVSNTSDWGGNKIKVRWYKKKSNLHGVWDYEMLDTMEMKYPKSLDYLATVNVDHSNPNILDWFNESLALARSHAYVNTDGTLVKMGDKLGRAYLDRNKPIVLDRIVLAAERLADLLNGIAIGEQPRVFLLKWNVDSQ